MAHRQTFTRDRIVEAAYQLTREQGWQAVSARSIAQALGSSTMPIYSTLKSMDEIEREVRTRAQTCMQEYQHRAWTSETLLNAAMGYVVFARDEPRLFRFLYVDRPVTAAAGAADATQTVESTGGAVDLAQQAAVAMKDHRVLKSWAFTHGLASLVGAGVLALADNDIQRLLAETGAAIFSRDVGGRS